MYLNKLLSAYFERILNKIQLLFQVFLRDTDERACAYIAGAAPNRWGFTSDGRDLNTLVEPVPSSLSGICRVPLKNFLVLLQPS